MCFRWTMFDSSCQTEVRLSLKRSLNAGEKSKVIIIKPKWIFLGALKIFNIYSTYFCCKEEEHRESSHPETIN